MICLFSALHFSHRLPPIWGRITSRSGFNEPNINVSKMDARRIETQFQPISGGKWIHPARVHSQNSQAAAPQDI